MASTLRGNGENWPNIGHGMPQPGVSPCGEALFTYKPAKTGFHWPLRESDLQRQSDF